jgi:hypothetical protein
LQEIQEDYDWKSQFMSEPALGKAGGLMRLAFLFLALAIIFHAGAITSKAQKTREFPNGQKEQP